MAAWFLNLETHPEATVQVGPVRTRAIAREARADERAELGARFVAIEPGYNEYARRTTRTIPAVVLEPMR